VKNWAFLFVLLICVSDISRGENFPSPSDLSATAWPTNTASEMGFVELGGGAYTGVGPYTIETLSGSFKSPDGKFEARIASSNGVEAKGVGIYSGSKFISEQLFPGENGQGSAISKVAWTADSKYLVYSWMSSGGHQAWVEGVAVFCAARGEIQGLNYFESIINDSKKFILLPDDNISFKIWTRDKNSNTALPIIINLRDVCDFEEEQ
jgi:hypothetical protein